MREHNPSLAFAVILALNTQLSSVLDSFPDQGRERLAASGSFEVHVMAADIITLRDQYDALTSDYERLLAQAARDADTIATLRAGGSLAPGATS